MKCILKIVSNLALLTFTLCATGYAFALCSDAPRTLENEFKLSNLVVLARADSVKVIAVADDPEGIARFEYQVKVTKVFKGANLGQVLKVSSENTSARFPMDVGIEYLLFLSPILGDLTTDLCGHSGLAISKQHDIHILNSLSGAAAK